MAASALPALWLLLQLFLSLLLLLQGLEPVDRGWLSPPRPLILPEARESARYKSSAMSASVKEHECANCARGGYVLNTRVISAAPCCAAKHALAAHAVVVVRNGASAWKADVKRCFVSWFA